MKNPQDKRREHETTALLWLQVAQECNEAKFPGSRAMALGLASLAMDCADASVITVTVK
jgi:hypothetical protein